MNKTMIKLFLFVAAILVAISFPAKIFASTDTVTVSTEVSEALTLSLSSGSLALGSLTPGTPVRGSNGIVVNVQTSASNGYNLGVSDGVAGSDSALLHSDTATRIPDASALIAAPAVWASGVTKGLGVTVFAADTGKEVKWGTGTTYDDSNNKYAGVPQTATTIHSSPGFKASADTTSLAFIVDVENSQKTGAYSGNITLTATAVLN